MAVGPRQQGLRGNCFLWGFCHFFPTLLASLHWVNQKPLTFQVDYLFSWLGSLSSKVPPDAFCQKLCGLLQRDLRGSCKVFKPWSAWLLTLTDDLMVACSRRRYNCFLIIIPVLFIASLWARYSLIHLLQIIITNGASQTKKPQMGTSSRRGNHGKSACPAWPGQSDGLKAEIWCGDLLRWTSKRSTWGRGVSQTACKAEDSRGRNRKAQRVWRCQAENLTAKGYQPWGLNSPGLGSGHSRCVQQP